MHIQDVFDAHKTTFSFEFFPPKSDAAAASLYQSIAELKTLKPSFVSVTYGAGGSTRQRTHDLVIRVRKELGVSAVPHLTCVCHSEQDIHEILQRYADEGVTNILALGGDPPRDIENYSKADDAFQHAANLVKYIHDFAHPDQRGFGIGVAGFPEGHPSTPNRLLEMDYLKAKVDSGADYIVTQLFFNNDDFYDFRERCELAGIDIPIIAGIMPITSGKGMKRMAELAAGSRYPAKLLRAQGQSAATVYGNSKKKTNLFSPLQRGEGGGEGGREAPFRHRRRARLALKEGEGKGERSYRAR